MKLIVTGDHKEILGMLIVPLLLLDHIAWKKKNGDLPFTWLGRNVHPIKQWGGLDIDYDWQVPIVEFWLKANGFTEKETPYNN